MVRKQNSYMKHIDKYSWFVFFTCLLLNSQVFAQIKANYHFGFIGSTGDTLAKLSEPVMIQYSKCFEITNGLPKFKHPYAGAFSIACYEVPPKIDLLVTAYPNPVVNQLMIRSTVFYPEKGKGKYSVLISDLMGNLIRRIQTNLFSINQGFALRVDDLPIGYFIVTLYVDKERVQSFKILKAI